MNVFEILGLVTGAASVWLAVKENVWNWPIGVANSAFFLGTFLASRLYANSGLQVLYIVLGLYGWWNWHYGGAERSILHVRRTTRAAHAVLLITTLAGTLVLTALLARFTDSRVPFWDGLTTALSLTATYMLTAKLFESWWVWILTDLVYIPLYASQRLYLTSCVYALFLGMCCKGVVEWRRSLLKTEAQLSETKRVRQEVQP